MFSSFGCFLALFLGAYGFIQNTAGTTPEDLVKRAQSGDANAQFELGRAYEDGKGFPQDDDSAAVWLRKAAEQGNAKAQSSLGALYSVGRGSQGQRTSRSLVQKSCAARAAGSDV